MKRIPNDLNDNQIRNEYIENHVQWFLNHHEDALKDFWKEVESKYGHKMNGKSKKLSTEQKSLF